jgi:hypothetical protein
MAANTRHVTVAARCGEGPTIRLGLIFGMEHSQEHYLVAKASTPPTDHHPAPASPRLQEHTINAPGGRGSDRRGHRAFAVDTDPNPELVLKGHTSPAIERSACRHIGCVSFAPDGSPVVPCVPQRTLSLTVVPLPLILTSPI